MKKILLHQGWVLAAIVSLCTLILISVYLEKKYDQNLAKQNESIAIQNDEIDKKKAKILSERQRLDDEFKNKIAGAFGQTTVTSGVQIRIEGVEIHDRFLGPKQILALGRDLNGEGRYEINEVLLDPDLPNRGFPDLSIQVLEARPFNDSTFFDRLLDKKFRLPKIFDKQTSKLDSFYWKTDDNNILVERHALQFAIDVATFYSSKDHNDHLINRDLDLDIFDQPYKSGREWDNQRYPNIGIVLSFTPQTVELASTPNEEAPQFALTAVELMNVRRTRAFKDNTIGRDMGADRLLTAGKTLPLYNEFEQLPLKSKRSNIDETLYKRSPDQEISKARDSIVGKNLNAILNKGVFGKKKWAVLNINNIGTIKQQSVPFFGSKTKISEGYRLVFGLHLLVNGAWSNQYQPLTDQYGDLEKKSQIQREDSLVGRVLSSAFDVLIPSFGLGAWGKGIVFLFIGLLLAPIFPAFLQVVIAFSKLIVKAFSSSAKLALGRRHRS